MNRYSYCKLLVDVCRGIAWDKNSLSLNVDQVPSHPLAYIPPTLRHWMCSIYCQLWDIKFDLQTETFKKIIIYWTKAYYINIKGKILNTRRDNNTNNTNQFRDIFCSNYLQSHSKDCWSEQISLKLILIMKTKALHKMIVQ